MKNLFEEIIENCNHKKVESLCKSLSKKFSVKAGKDMEKLCHLTYWLYILGKNELVKKCINITHEITFDQNFNVWTFIHLINGLEIRILRQDGKNNLADEIIDKMDNQLKMPIKNIPETVEKAEIRENKLRERIVVENESNEKEIENSLKNNDIKTANEYRFIGIMRLMGKLETGFYRNINKEREKVEIIIEEYKKEILK